MAAIMNSFVDATLIAADNALRTLLAPHRAARPTPQPPAELAAHPAALSDAEQRLSGALMRVNHVGEICAQALYTGQAYAARIAPQLPKDKILLVNLSGRGDKDMHTVAEKSGLTL